MGSKTSEGKVWGVYVKHKLIFCKQDATGDNTENYKNFTASDGLIMNFLSRMDLIGSIVNGNIVYCMIKTM